MSKLSRGAGVAEGKGEDLIGQILTAQHQRGHSGFWGGIQIYETPVHVLLTSNPWCGSVLSILRY